MCHYFVLNFDVIRDQLLNRRTATWNIFIKTLLLKLCTDAYTLKCQIRPHPPEKLKNVFFFFHSENTSNVSVSIDIKPEKFEKATIILDLCLRENSGREMHDYQDVNVFQNVFHAQ